MTNTTNDASIYHNAKTMYLERYAKEMLEQLFPDSYADIELKDAPDLRMGPNHGIEVTRAMFDHQGQADGILNHINGHKTDQVDPRFFRTMERINAEPIVNEEDRICGYIPKWGNSIRIQELLKAYIAKKNKAKYYNVKHIDLFIYPPLAQIDGWLGEEMIGEFFLTVHQDETNPFEHLIIYEEPTIYLYDVLKDQMKQNRGTKDIIYQCKKAADDYSCWSKRQRKG